ncbi:TatD family hydrolase [Mesobacillus foraminis]|uniref:TatD family hydrolase n=1 Tax=Mesobacillus foraminis TaxID=279826 RepID=UPI001BEC0C12|nr:TatD family hydrolase [Mesobacillus foraminis]MBT2755399.1 TatD family hydrolase [Mesobacillus foraminis]
MKIIDAHIHLDQYKDQDIERIINDAEAVIAVSTNLESSKRTARLAKNYKQIKPAFGYHPEQSLPSERELAQLISWIKTNGRGDAAIGEVGLPYYLSKKNRLPQPIGHYIEVLEAFIMTAKELDQPIVLHAVYDDASIVCDLLEKHSVRKAHFHWFKGSKAVAARLVRNGYNISITPDILYEEEIRQLAETFPITSIMAETDGPWPFNGPFKGKLTRPNMIHAVLNEIANIKHLNRNEVYEQIFVNTRKFYFNSQ